VSEASAEERGETAVSEIALLTWDGGGNVAVTMAIAVALRERGRSVTVIGPRSLQHAVDALGVGYAELGILPPRDPQQRLGYLLDVIQGSDAMLSRLRRLVGRADALVIDCNLSWALQSRVARRTAILVHTAVGLYLPVWQAVLDMANAQRSALGLPALAAAVDAWSRSDLLLVASLAGFDRPLPTGRLRPVYVGPVSAQRSRQAGPLSIPPAGDRPPVLISYSTDSLQNSPRRLQTALDALDGLPVSVLASTSGAFDATRLRVPGNATVLDYLPHDSVMATVALVVCHAGHGTTMAALTHGVPLICVPGLGRDQEPIAMRVSELGLGIALQRDASARMIRDAAKTILADHRYRESARDFAQRTAQPDGAQRAAAELLTVLDDPSDA
jgi:UDP:flavonoid glycosyltransferase YjiC (YdhE family)